MSHITDVKFRARDLDAIEVAGEARGFVLMRGQTEHAWYGRMVGDSAEGRQVARERGVKNLGKCDHVLRLKDHRAGLDYEIGLVKAKDGDGYDLLYDSWGPGQRLVEAAGGPNLQGLRQEYTAAVLTRKAKAVLARQGFKVERQQVGSRIRLRMRRR